jgi:uncharacterized protein YbjT (DUF2867 family)
VSGCEAVLDVTNVETLRRATAVRFFTTATGRLLDAARRAGAVHHVVLSVVGVDRVDIGYYTGKLRQERLVEDSVVPLPVLRAAQFHEFAQQVTARNRGPFVLVPRMRVQPVAAADVAAHLAALVTGPPASSVLELVGPEVHELPDLVRRLGAAIGDRRRVVPIRVPGSAGRAMREGGLLPAGPATLGRTTFAEWLKTV